MSRILLLAAAVLGAAAGAVSCVAIDDEAPGGRPADGRLECEPAQIAAAGEARFRITFTVGRSGILQGGGFRIQLPVDPVRPHFGFTPPHTGSPDKRGHVRCAILRQGSLQGGATAQAGEGGAASCSLDRGRLQEGDAIVMEYWGQAPRAAADHPLPAMSRLSGGRGGAPIENPPHLLVTARPARLIQAVLPSSAAVGEPMTLALAALDEFGNRAGSYRGEVRIDLAGSHAAHTFTPEEEGLAVLPGLAVEREGFARAAVSEVAPPGGIPIAARSNPVDVAKQPGDPILWGDLEFHTGAGAGRGDAARQWDAYTYARDVMRLDFAAAAERATARFSDADWQESLRVAERLDDPPRFTTIPGFAWDGRLVLLREASGPLVRSDRRATDEAAELEAALASRPSVIVATAEPERGTRAEVAEIYSARNRDAAGDDHPLALEPGPRWLEGTLPASVAGASGNAWGRPGLDDATGLEPGAGGLTAVIAHENGREAILDALARGRAWATTGARIYLRVEQEAGRIQIRAAGTTALAKAALVVVQSGGTREIPLMTDPREDLSLSVERPRAPAPAFCFVRVVQVDGEVAWSSPLPLGAGTDGAGEGRRQR